MIIAVLDTNVLVSGFPAQRGVPAALIGFWRQGLYHLVVSDAILSELTETWRAPYWQARYSPMEAADAIALLRADAIVVPLTAHVAGVATHPEDDLILATAVSSGAGYLVTGDRRLRTIGAYADVAILSPREFFSLLASASDEQR